MCPIRIHYKSQESAYIDTLGRSYAHAVIIATLTLMTKHGNFQLASVSAVFSGNHVIRGSGRDMQIFSMR